MLMSDVGSGNSVSNLTITFDDQAPPLPDTSALTSGTFNPAKIAALGGSVATIAGLAKKAGIPITDQLPPGLGG